MNKLIASIVAAAGLASLANAQAVTRMSVETSLDGISWASGTRQVNPGTNVRVRYNVSYIANGSTTIPVGFATLTFQPTVSNWTGADTLGSFATIGNNTNGGAVTDASGEYGRIIPFASTGPTSTDPYRGHTQTISGTSYLRIARTVITNWVGDGATTGTAAANNFNGSGGLATVQKSSGNVGANDPAFNPSITNVTLFRFAVTLSSSTAARTLLADAPLAGMNRNATTGARDGSWFLSGADNFGSIKAPVEVIPASIEVIPAPGALGLLGLGGAMALRRRRHA